MRSLPFPCCWRCPFHGDARGHGRGGRCSQPLPFIPGSRGEERGSRCRGERGRRGGHPRGPGGAPRRRRRSGLPPTPPTPHFPRRRPFPGKLGYCGLLSPRRWGRAGRGQAAGRAAELRGRAALAPAPPAAAAGRGEAGGGALPPAALARSGSPAALCPGASPASVCLWARARWGVPASSPLPGREVVPQLRSLPPSAGGERSRTPRLGCFLV